MRKKVRPGLDVCEWNPSGEVSCPPPTRWLFAESSILACCPFCWLKICDGTIQLEPGELLVSRDGARTFEIFRKGSPEVKHVLLKREVLLNRDVAWAPEWIVVPSSKWQGPSSCWEIVSTGSKNSMRKRMLEEQRFYFVSKIMRE